MTVTPPRRLALAVLRRVREGDLLDRSAAGALAELPPRDRGWFQELVYGTVRLRGRLDYRLDRLLKRGVGSVREDVLDVLRLGAYQLLYMGSVPAYAAVSQSVDMARHVAGSGAAGLVNGVLKNLERNRDEDVFPRFDDDAARWLETWGSHPRWLVDRWLGRFGADGARDLVEADNRAPELYVRPLGVPLGFAAEAFEAAGLSAEPVRFSPDVLRMAAGTDPGAALATVPAVVQDAAAALVTRYAAFEGGPVADLCAAPGGKAAALAERDRLVVALDVSRRRMRRVVSNARRLAGSLAGRVAPVVADGRAAPLRPVPGVLVDAPCTGTGTLRRHPDGRWRMGPGEMASLVTLQEGILDGAAEVVAPGGLLVYATCSLEAEENEEQVEAFLRRHPEFELEPSSTVDPSAMDDAGRLVVLPQRHGADGAFAARLRRRRGRAG